MEFKLILSFFVIILTFGGYIPYILDTVRRRTKPHTLTWLSVSIIAFTAYSIQVFGGAGVGAWPMLVVTILCGIVFLLSLRNRIQYDKLDIFFFILSLVGLCLYLFFDLPLLSILIITVVEIFAFIPTIRKSWKDPYSETLSLYTISSVRFFLLLFALENLNLLTGLYPFVWMLINALIASILIIRRRIGV